MTEGLPSTVSLPPLPEAVTVNAAPHDSRWQWNAYTGTQMRDYAQAAISAVASERDALAVRVRELEGELQWLDGFFGRYDPPGVPNRVVRRIRAALTTTPESKP